VSRAAVVLPSAALAPVITHGYAPTAPSTSATRAGPCLLAVTLWARFRPVRMAAA